MYNSRYSLFIGRYQPFHEGHKWLIQQRLNEGKSICIAIMDIHDLEPEKNPYSANMVKENIDNDWRKLCNILNIPYTPMVHTKKGKSYENYTSFYDKETIKIITNMYKRDLQIFNYKFNG